MAIGNDGYPVISHYDSANGDLKVTKCGDASCSTATSVTVDPSSNQVGGYSSIAIGVDGFPVIATSIRTLYTLKVAKCSSASCSSSTITTVDDPATNLIDWTTSIRIGADDLPIIAWYLTGPPWI